MKSKREWMKKTKRVKSRKLMRMLKLLMRMMRIMMTKTRMMSERDDF